MKRDKEPVRTRWALLRFSIIGPLLMAPPKPGELQSALAELAAKTYRHPTTGEALRFGVSTIERWFYQAKNTSGSPLDALARKVPSHTGRHPSMSTKLEIALRAQYQQHPRWSYQLHRDNLLALAKEHPELGKVPSYTTISRFMKAQGLFKQRRQTKGKRSGPGMYEGRETRSFEVEHVHALWHADYHVGSRRVLLPSGEWAPCYLLAILDDRSRLCCHLQWYLQQTAETFVHGLSQAILKRGLPRALMTDNGSAMMASETIEGLQRLGIVHYPTLPYTPAQNAKAEIFWALSEGRLMPMLERVPMLTLALLNQATQSWVELEYHRSIHRELAESPLNAAMNVVSVARPAPESQTLRHLFRTEETRAQRRSDGTITVGGTRFELPSRYRTLLRPMVRFARWDLSSVDLVCPRNGTILCELYPLDKNRNADRKRRVLEPPINIRTPAPEQPASVKSHTPPEYSDQGGIAPHLRQLMREYAATGLPPAYLPHTSEPDEEQTETNAHPATEHKLDAKAGYPAQGE